MISIINLHHGGLPPGAVYTGRAAGKYKGSPLANPFPMRNEDERSIVIERYSIWLNYHLVAEDSPASLELKRLLELAKNGDLILACWCAPKACHCDIIKAKIEAMATDEVVKIQSAIGHYEAALTKLINAVARARKAQDAYIRAGAPLEPNIGDPPYLSQAAWAELEDAEASLIGAENEARALLRQSL